MNELTVCAVMLTADRPEIARRAVECFRRQTYERKHTCIYDTGRDMMPYSTHMAGPGGGYTYGHFPERRDLTVGAHRNLAIERALAFYDAEILIHWDDDDYSHPNRIAEQVALLQASGAECVGYNEMLFWREQAVCPACGSRYRRYADPDGVICAAPDCGEEFFAEQEAWLYRNPDPRYCLGTSLCYWRSTWERRPFESTSQGEDIRWLMGVKSFGCTSSPALRLRSMPEAIQPTRNMPIVDVLSIQIGDGMAASEPRMIARIHGGNTSNAYAPEKMRACSEWRRAPEWDQHCREIMAV